MKSLAFVVAACALATSACSTRVPTDAELVTLLQRAGTPAGDANAPLDATAVQCLRSWSGDASLTKDLAPAVLADVSKARCRGTIDGWIADSKRNPGKLEFAQVSTPDVARRAMALLAAHQPAQTEHKTAAATLTPAPTAHAAEPGPAPEIEATLAHARERPIDSASSASQRNAPTQRTSCTAPRPASSSACQIAAVAPVKTSSLDQ